MSINSGEFAYDFLGETPRSATVVILETADGCACRRSRLAWGIQPCGFRKLATKWSSLLSMATPIARWSSEASIMPQTHHHANFQTTKLERWFGAPPFLVGIFHLNYLWKPKRGKNSSPYERAPNLFGLPQMGFPLLHPSKVQALQDGRFVLQANPKHLLLNKCQSGKRRRQAPSILWKRKTSNFWQDPESGVA